MRHPTRRAAIRGMTLIEILVVLVLIGIVLGIVGGNFIGRGEKAKADAAKVEIGQIAQALDLYKLEVGRYPTTQEGLQALVSAPTGTANWNGPYWKKAAMPKDPWNNEYRYVSPAQGAPFEIISLGADGKEGGEGARGFSGEEPDAPWIGGDRACRKARTPAKACFAASVIAFSCFCRSAETSQRIAKWLSGSTLPSTGCRSRTWPKLARTFVPLPR
jgi:general secretion pathway protein G